ncbi:MAG: phosphatase PAP2 family protein [Bacteroidaceae bacterium]|nr:phosphatase PAP2 family protein [Bacteroidaceae bacterium]
MEEIIRFDQQLLLLLNGSDSVWLDQFFVFVTRTTTWLPLLALLVYVLFKNRPWREALLVLVCLGLVILVCDQFASSFCKPFFQRYRPSHEPALSGLVDLVEGRRGGLYGFISSHAANTFGVFAYLGLYFRRWLITSALLFWACLSSYSRIYLGFHYPGDIIVGALFGLLMGYLIYRLLCTTCSRWLQPLRPEWPAGVTIMGHETKSQGIARGDAVLFFAATFATIVLVALLPALHFI